MIAERFNTDHHTIKRKLMACGVKITRRNTLKEFTQSHRDKISAACKGRPCWARGLKMNETFRRKNMISHLRFAVDLGWSQTFDLDVLMAINSALTSRSGRFSIDTCRYKAIVEKWGRDTRVLKIVKNWKENGKHKYLALSFDHIHPRCKGGKDEVENLRPMTWFENRSKNDMSDKEWSFVKENLEMFFL
jgi:hypothetical protein